MQEKVVLISIAVLISFLIFFSFRVGLFAGLENFFEDLLFVPRPFSEDIAIISVDSESINRIGQWPWPREIFATSLYALSDYKPRAVGIDVMFSEPSGLGAADDKELKSALQNVSYPVVLPLEILEEKPLEPLEIFRKSASIGHVNLILDKDGVVRKFFPTVFLPNKNQQKIPAFSVQLLKAAGIPMPKEKSLTGPLRIVYATPAGAVRRVPFYQLLDREIPASFFKDKIVLIGATSPDLHDEQLTPFSRGEAMPGVEIQANIVNMLLKGFRLELLNKTLMSFWLFFAGILPAFIFILFRRSLKPLFANLFLGAVYVVAALLLADNDIIPNFIHLNAAWVLSTAGLFSFRYFAGEKERRELHNLFSRYVNKEVLEEILKNSRDITLGGEETEITILFSDIRGFTTISEALSSKDLVSLLNEYFEAMSGEVLKHKGVLDKYIGDAIMAFWGSPVKDKEQADNAVKAAFGMVDRLDELNQSLSSRGKPVINIGIGIYTGPAVVGNIGSRQRFDYTAIGDSVNIASRLEGLNKTYGTKIIIGESVKEQLKGDYGFKLVGSVEVKGRKQPINIYTKG